ncbi:MAG: NAD(P)-binding domain-containing protein, partial [Bacteroidales bacterium]|nr:NAD(P)-binding domain-containing protein [Bacteroidales bacterium]
MFESEIKKIVIIGAGNVATNLAQALTKAGFDIIQIYGRTNHLAKALADKVKSSYTSNLSDLNMEGDIYFVSVVDSALKDILKKINVGDKLIVHTS